MRDREDSRRNSELSQELKSRLSIVRGFHERRLLRQVYLDSVLNESFDQQLEELNDLAHAVLNNRSDNRDIQPPPSHWPWGGKF